MLRLKYINKNFKVNIEAPLYKRQCTQIPCPPECCAHAVDAQQQCGKIISPHCCSASGDASVIWNLEQLYKTTGVEGRKRQFRFGKKSIYLQKIYLIYIIITNNSTNNNSIGRLNRQLYIYVYVLCSITICYEI